MTKIQENALASRTAAFAKAIRLFAGEVPKTLATVDDLKQLIRASGSMGAAYIETEESLSKRDFMRCITTCRKDARECIFWLRQLSPSLPQEMNEECGKLEDEASALLRIFTASMQ